MRISPVVSNTYTFKSSQKENTSPVKQESNPVSSAGEKAILAKTTFLAGLALGGRLLLELMDGGFVFESFAAKAQKITSKQQGLSKNKKMVKQVGVFAGLTAMFVAGVAAIYTIAKAPEINYKGNVNAFKNKKDMDVYIKGNTVEKELYTQMNEKAKNADEQEKAKLKEQYLQMQMAKNQIPDFVNRK